MSLPFDPYKPPMASLDAPPTAEASGTVPASVLDILAKTRPWVKFMSILMFVMMGLMLLGGLAVLAFPAAQKPLIAFLPMAIVMLFYIPPALFLWRCAAQLRELERGGGVPALERALANQKSFWKYVGIFAIVLLCLYAVAIAAGAMVGRLLR